MADTQIDPFADAIVVEDDSTQADPFAGAVVVGESSPVEDLEEIEPVNENSFQYLDDNRDLIGKNVDLPDPETTMYNDIKNEGDGFMSYMPFGESQKSARDKAQQRYNFYADHPESRRQLDGSVVYKNKVVPPPEQSFLGNMKVDLGTKMYGGIKNAGVELLSTGEIATDLVGVTDPNTTYVNDNFASLSTGDSTLDSVITEGTSLLTGGGAIAKLVGKAPKLGKYGNTVLKFLGFEAGAASSVSSDSGTLLVGDNALMKELGWQPDLLKGFDVDATDSKAKQELAKRVNILVDGMSAAGVMTNLVKGVDMGGRMIYNIFIDPLARVGSINRMEQDFMGRVLDKLVNVGDDPQAIEAARVEITKLVEEGKNLYVDLPPQLAAKVNATVDSMTAIERALASNDTESARELIMQASALKKGTIATPAGTNKTAIAQGRVPKALDDTLVQAENNLGGGDAIQQTSKALQEQGVSEVDNAAMGVVRAEDNIDNLNVRIVQELTTDPSLIGKVTDLETRTGFDIGSVKERSADSIVSNLSKASEKMDTTKNSLFDAIKGGTVDFESLTTTLKNLKPEQLDKAAAAMPGNSQFGTLLEQIKLRPKFDDAGKQVGTETVEEMQDRFSSWAVSNKLDFARLFTDIRPGLVDSINSLELGNAAEKGAAKTLIQFKKWIDEDAITYLRENGDEETLEAAEEAMRYFKEDWAPFWDDGSTLGKVGTLRRNTIQRGKQEPRFEDEARSLVKGTINDDSRSVAANMVKLLDRPEGGQSATDVTDFIIGDVLTTLSTKLDTTENVSDLGLNAVRQSLSRYSTLIRKNFGQEADRLDSLVNRLGDNKLTKEVLQRELVEAKRLAKEAEERIYNQELNGFFKGQGVPNPNGYAILETIFKGKQSSDQLSGLMARAEGDPVITAGIQAAYTRWFRTEMLGTTTSTAGDKVVKISNEALNREGVKNAFDYASIVFADTPQFVSALDTLLTEAGGIQRSRASKAIPTGSGTAEQAAAIAAVNRGVTATVGVLSTLGARIRSTATGIIQQNIVPETYFNVVDSLMADPDEFIRVAKETIRLQKGVGTIPIRLPFTRGKALPAGVFGGSGAEPVYYLDRGAMYKMMVKVGIYREGDESDQREFYEILAQTELDFTRARDELFTDGGQPNDLDAQTRALVTRPEITERSEEKELGFVPKP